MASVNFADMVRNASPSSSFSPLPVGEYNVVVSGAEFKQSSNGNPMFKVEFTVQDGPEANRKAWRNIAITERSVGMALEQLILLGTTQDAVVDAMQEGNEHGVAVVCGHLVDTPARIKIKHRDWEGKVQADVDRILPAAAGAADPLAAPVAPQAGAPLATSRPVTPF